MRGVAVVAGLVLAVALGVPGAASRGSGIFEANLTFTSVYEVGAPCPAGTPATTTECVRFTSTEEIRGLGLVASTYVKRFDPATCPEVTQPRTVVFEVRGKGELHVAMEWPVCSPPAPAEVGPIRAEITAGTGRFVGASGTLQFSSSVAAGCQGARGITGTSTDTWTGAIVAPAHEFDFTPPVITARPRTVRAPRGAARVRVRYSVVARDAVDGVVRTVCNPTSGSRFRVGRTRVTCTAVDSSFNEASVAFAVTVRRR